MIAAPAPGPNITGQVASHLLLFPLLTEFYRVFLEFLNLTTSFNRLRIFK